MNKETKGILNYMKQYAKEPNAPDYNGEYPQPWEITIEEVQCILDYITNLQEENERLNEVANERMKTILKIEDYLDEYLTSEFRFEGDSYDKGACIIIDEVSNIINELKGDTDE